jgi:hypothetical protein
LPAEVAAPASLSRGVDDSPFLFRARPGAPPALLAGAAPASAAATGLAALPALLSAVCAGLSAGATRKRRAEVAAAASRVAAPLQRRALRPFASLDGRQRAALLGKVVARLAAAAHVGCACALAEASEDVAHGDAAMAALAVAPRCARSRCARSRCALHFHARRGDAGAITRLLRAADADVRDAAGDAPLHHAAQGGHAAAVRALLRVGADVNAENARGISPSVVAAAQPAGAGGRANAALVALLDAGACVNAELSAARPLSPLITSISAGVVANAEALLDAGVDVNASNHLKTSPLHHRLLACRGDRRPVRAPAPRRVAAARWRRCQRAQRGRAQLSAVHLAALGDAAVLRVVQQAASTRRTRSGRKARTRTRTRMRTRRGRRGPRPRPASTRASSWWVCEGVRVCASSRGCAPPTREAEAQLLARSLTDPLAFRNLLANGGRE